MGCVMWKVWKEGRNVEEEGEDGGRLGKVGKGEERHTAECILYTPDSDVISTRGFPSACAEDLFAQNAIFSSSSIGFLMF